MKYPQDQFFRLMEEIEFQDGVHLDATCENRYVTPLTGDKVKGVEVAMCGENALFEVPYEPLGSDTISKVRVCAVDDRVGLWPRFAGANAPGIG